jgi:hypothetical protein
LREHLPIFFVPLRFAIAVLLVVLWPAMGRCSQEDSHGSRWIVNRFFVAAAT